MPSASSTSISKTAGPRARRCCSRGPPAIPTGTVRWGTTPIAGRYAAGWNAATSATSTASPST